MFYYSQMAGHPPISARDARSLSNWHLNHLNAIQAAESSYINYTRDLFSVVPNPKSHLRHLFEKSVHSRNMRRWRVKKEDIESSGHDGTHELHLFDEKFDTFTSVITACIGLVMLIAPLWILEFTNSSIASLAWITGFIILFHCLFTYATVAKPFEVSSEPFPQC